VAIARALAMEPEVIQGLAEEGRTMIMVTHEMIVPTLGLGNDH